MTKEFKPCSGKNIAFSTNGAGSTGGQLAEEYKLIHPCIKLNSKWIKDLHIEPDTLKLIEKKLWKTLEDMGTGGKFLNRTPIVYALRLRIDQ